MRFLQIGLTLAFAIAALAEDAVTLRDGRVITGAYLGGSARELRIDVGNQIRTLNIADVASIQFGATAIQEGRERDVRESDVRDRNARDQNVRDQDVRETRPRPSDGLLLPAGTNLVIRMIDGVDSERSSIGQTFAASMDEPVMIDGQTVIPRGADVVVKLVDAQQSGKLTGRTELTLDLVSVDVNGRMVDVNTETVKERSSSRGARTAKVAGGTAVLGTIIGAIAGGGRGAAIGAGAGAAVGAGAEIVTKGQRVRIPSETRLTFVLENGVRLN